MRMILVVAAMLVGNAHGQSMYRCEVDGVIVFSHLPCAQEQIDEHENRPNQRQRTEPGQTLEPVSETHSGQISQLDIHAYCEDMRQASGSFQVRDDCLDSERSARDRVLHHRIPPEVIAYCNPVGELSGSYQIMEACIRHETAARQD